MKLIDLVRKLYDIVKKNIALIIDPLVKENKDWDAIEFKIDEWFNTYDVFSWSQDYVKMLGDNGELFYDQNGNTIAVENVIEFLKEKDFYGNAQKDIKKEYYDMMHPIHSFSCAPDYNPFVRIDKNGKLVGYGCGSFREFE